MNEKIYDEQPQRNPRATLEAGWLDQAAEWEVDSGEESMKRQLFIVDGEFRSFDTARANSIVPRPEILTSAVTPAEQSAYEFGRQEKAEEILEALAREFFGEKKP